MTFIRPRPVAWFFFLSAFATTLALGSWQVHRLQWKQGLITKIEAARDEAPLTALPETEAELSPLNFYPVSIGGTWVEGVEFHITPRFFQGKLGYFLISPLMLPDGRTLLINRGWIPAAAKDPESRPGTLVEGRGAVRGILRVGDERNGLTPENDPSDNIWFGRDIEAMAAHVNLPRPVPAMVDVVGVQDVERLPIPSDGTIKLRNDHLSYILTWYGIALGILTIFILYHRKR